MRPFLSLLAAGFTLLTLTACQPEAEHTASDEKIKTASAASVDWSVPQLSSNVWKISKAGQPDSYLAGTIHIGKKEAVLSKEAENLLASVEQLTTETDVLPEENPETQQQYQQFFNQATDTKSLKAKLGDKVFKSLQEAFRINPETAPLAEAVDGMKPWAAFLFAQSVYPTEYSSTTGVDMLLSKAAQKAGKPRRFLETMPQLAESFSAFPEETIIHILKTTTDDNKDFLEQTHEMYGLYESGNFDGFADTHKKYEQQSLKKYPELAPLMLNWFQNDLLVGRNLKWLPEIKAQSAEKSTLFAVGIMHLMSQQGLIELLRKDGYEVTPMPKILMW